MAETNYDPSFNAAGNLIAKVDVKIRPEGQNEWRNLSVSECDGLTIPQMAEQFDGKDVIARVMTYRRQRAAPLISYVCGTRELCQKLMEKPTTAVTNIMTFPEAVKRLSGFDTAINEAPMQQDVWDAVTNYFGAGEVVSFGVDEKVLTLWKEEVDNSAEK